MKILDRNKLHEEIEKLGLSLLSQFSAKSYISKKGLPIKLLMHLEIRIQEICALLYGMIPFALEGNKKEFEEQIQTCKDSIDNLINATVALQKLNKKDE